MNLLFSARTLSLSLVMLLLAGCASSTVMTGKARPAIAPEQVKLYRQPPKKYEEIALIESSSQASLTFSSQAKMDKVIERLKQEAAKVGANGVLLQSTGEVPGGGISTGVSSGRISRGGSYGGTGVGTSIGIANKAGSGIAIYVIEE